MKADLIFTNGSVYTVDRNRSWTTAVAIGNGKLIAVGSDFQIDDFKGPSLN